MFRQIISFEKAKEIINKEINAKPLGMETVQLEEAYNRVLAENVKAPFNVPSFNRSTVDGYAVRAEDTFGASEQTPVKLKLAGRVEIEEKPDFSLEKGSTAEVATGAAIPDGADAVVMMEYTNLDKNEVLIYRAVANGGNVMKVGADIRKGETVLFKGELLDPRKVGVLAALGIKNVKVYRKPKVAVISTGPEIIEPGKPLQLGKVYDINSYTLASAVSECGAVPINLGTVPDEEQKIREKLKKALEIADVVLTSGGVSVGPHDLMPKILASLSGSRLIICGIAIKPGKPTTVAVVNDKPVFALPGQPTSALFTFYLFVRPVLYRMVGKEEKPLRVVNAFAAEKMFAAKGRRTFTMVYLRKDKEGRFWTHPVEPGLSGAISSLAKAEGFVEIPENRQFIDVGEKVQVHLLVEDFPFSH